MREREYIAAIILLWATITICNTWVKLQTTRAEDEPSISQGVDTEVGHGSSSTVVSNASHAGQIRAYDELPVEKVPSSLFERQWPYLKQKMCPNMMPSHHVFLALFELARMQLDFPDDKVVANAIDEPTIEKFYKFNYGGVLYTSPGSREQEEQYTAYLRIFKAGNDQIRTNLMDVLETSGNGTIREVDTIAKLFDSVGKSDQISEACVVTAVRDPIERFLSAYNEIEWRHEDGIRKGIRTDGGDGSPLYKKYRNGTVERFEKFVMDFIGGPKSSGIYISKSDGIEEITHIFSMVGPLWGLKRFRSCFGSDVHGLTTYLPDLADLDRTFPQMLHGACKGLPPFDKFQKKIVHGSQSDEFNFYRAAQQSWKHQGNTSEALCAIHALDYACYGDIPIPLVCKKVYGQEHFVKRVLSARSPVDEHICNTGHFP